MGDKGIGKKMKSMGRNMARASNQESGKRVPSNYASGGMVSKPMPPGAGEMRPPVAVKDKPQPKFGEGTARGTGAATKGKHFYGVR